MCFQKKGNEDQFNTKICAASENSNRKHQISKLKGKLREGKANLKE